MVAGQIGQLEIVQICAMVELKGKPEVVVIPHHLVKDIIVLEKQ